MVYVLYGDSEYKKKKFIDNLVKERNVEVKKIYPDSENKLEELKNSLSTSFLFSEDLLLVLVDFDDWKKDEKEQAQQLLKGAERDVVLLTDKKPTKLPKDWQILELSLPEEWKSDEWKEYIHQISKEQDYPLSKDLVEIFFEYVGADEYGIISEIEKLKLANVKNVEEAKEIIYRRTHSKLDEFTFAITELRKNDALAILDDIVEHFEGPYITASLFSHINDLLFLRTHVEPKQKYDWGDFKKYSTNYGIALPKVMRFLGGKFKNQEYIPVNHITLYTPEYLSDVIIKVYKLDRAFKIGEDPRILLREFILKWGEKDGI